MSDDVYLTPDLARAGRAFTKVSAKTIGQDAGLTKEQVRDYERGRRDLPENKKEDLKASLEKYGALFIPEGEDVGYGVRRKYPRETFMRLNTWEGEGGQVQNID